MARLLSLALVFTIGVMPPLWAEWLNVSVGVHDGSFTQGEDNAVVGPDAAFECARPASGPWAAQYSLQNHFANVGGQTVRVYSANSVTFRDFVVTAGDAGKSSHIAWKVVFSEAVESIAWDMGGHGRNLSDGARMCTRYSWDGVTWTDAHVYEAGPVATVDPPAVVLTPPQPAAEVYLGLFAEVPEGQYCWWNLGDTGLLTLAPAGGAAEAAEVGDADSSAAWDAMLNRERFIPNTFFGTTTHVNNEFANRLLDDLNMHAVRIDFRYEGLEPAPGQYSFAPDMWMIRSADLGLEAGLDQLVVLTAPPKWIQTEKGTFPSDEHIAVFEEFVYQIASKYKGTIRYWQAMNEPNMGLWKARFIVFLKAFHSGVKRADPANQVVLCGLAGIAPAHLDAIYRLGGKEYFDVLAAHAYTRPALPEDGDYIGKIRALHDVMVKYGDAKPLWVTEVGWNGVEPCMLPYLRSTSADHRNLSCSEEDQARGLARVYLISATIPWIERVYFFHLHQEAPYTSVMEPADLYMGLFTPWLEGQVRPKDAYFAVKTVIEMMSESTFKGRINTDPRVWALVFERGDEATVALWALDDGIEVRLSDASVIESVTSMVGTPVLMDENRLALSGRPIYLKLKASECERLSGQIAAAGKEAG
ncbi:MAG: hypothetical protein JXR94_23675 [Candidatus Hydrogenedentes bacterium]|nr:hypothetical protein [Candidatus Hydrogenedentota bacterium]